jgi:hypothetical protein
MSSKIYKIQKYTYKLQNTSNQAKVNAYKSKLLKYKNQEGGVEEVHMLQEVVPEFANNTKETYRNVTPRTLNSITLFTRDGTVEDSVTYINLKFTILHNQSKIARTDATTHMITDFLNILKTETPSSPQLIVQMEGFFSIIRDYKKDMDSGTYVTEDLFNEIFLVDKIPAAINIGGTFGKGFSASKGKGRENLNRVARELRDRGVKYMMLEAAGKGGLVDLYNGYGFKSILLPKYSAYFLIDSEMVYGGESENHIMIGKIDEIILKTA